MFFLKHVGADKSLGGIFKFGDVWHFSGHFYRQVIERIGLKVPANYYDQFRCNNISVLLLERRTIQKVRISGFLDPLGPLYLLILIYQIS